MQLLSVIYQQYHLLVLQHFSEDQLKHDRLSLPIQFVVEDEVSVFWDRHMF